MYYNPISDFIVGNHHDIKIDDIVNDIIRDTAPVQDFTADEGVGHHFCVIEDDETIAEITRIFKEGIPATYVADGHHRTAAAARVGIEKKENNPQRISSLFPAFLLQPGE